MKRALAVLAVFTIAAAIVALVLRRGGGDGPEMAGRDPARGVARLAPVKVVAPAVVATESAAASWLVEQGVAARRIAGVVLDGDRPAAGVRVVLRSELAATAGEDPPVATTDPAGRFDFGARAPTLYEVVATSGATRRATTRVEVRDPVTEPAPDDLTLRLESCAADVHGRVRDVDGQPIATAVLATMTTLTEVTPSIEVPVAADGTFAVCGGRMLHVRAPGYGSVMLLGPTPASGWDVVVFDEAVIEGTVVAAGQPVTGARVSPISFGVGGGARPALAAPSPMLTAASPCAACPRPRTCSPRAIRAPAAARGRAPSLSSAAATWPTSSSPSTSRG